MGEMADLDDEKFKAAFGPPLDKLLAEKGSYEKLKNDDGTSMMPFEQFQKETEENKNKIKEKLIQNIKEKCKAVKGGDVKPANQS